MATKRRPPKFNNARLLQLAEHLLPEDLKLKGEVQLAIDEPEKYVKKFAGQLIYRGIREPVPELPWIALTDGLIKRKRVVYLDWKFGPDELVDALQTLVRRQVKKKWNWDWIEDAADQEDETWRLMSPAGDRLLEQGLAFTTLDNNKVEDGFPVMIVSADRFTVAKSLAQQTGYGTITRWSKRDKIR